MATRTFVVKFTDADGEVLYEQSFTDREDFDAERASSANARKVKELFPGTLMTIDEFCTSGD